MMSTSEEAKALLLFIALPSLHQQEGGQWYSSRLSHDLRHHRSSFPLIRSSRLPHLRMKKQGAQEKKTKGRIVCEGG